MNQGRVIAAIFLCAVICETIPSPLSAQTTEGISYRNADDGTQLDASLALPEGPGPHPGVVVLSIAGTDVLVGRLVERGFAVLTPVRRGFVDVEPLLRATYADLAGDVRAAFDHLASRPEVDADALALVAQADDAPPALLATTSSASPVPLVLLAPPALPGEEELRRSQRWLARRAGAGVEELAALDRYVEGLVAIGLEESAPYVREYRLRRLRASSGVELPRNAAFPADERQAHFFASPLWHDRLAFDPEETFSRLSSPVLVLIGEDDANTPVEEYVAVVERGLAAAGGDDAATRVVPGRTRHAFTDDAIAAIVDWLAGRVGRHRPRPQSMGAVSTVLSVMMPPRSPTSMEP